jgi:thiosulfate/3-mercaptopyruvate sulfurtransferase
MDMIPPLVWEHVLGGLGISNNVNVIAYDNVGGKAAARLWWVSRYYGFHGLRVLDGGWARWRSEKRPVSRHPSKIAARGIVAAPQADYAIGCDELLNDMPLYQIVDARSYAEWCGEDAHGNRRSGRIPGAVNIEWCAFNNPDGSFKSMRQMTQIVTAAGLRFDRATVVYCQAGIRACHVAFVLQMIGFKRVRVFEGSMREWSSRVDTPMVTAPF